MCAWRGGSRSTRRCSTSACSAGAARPSVAEALVAQGVPVVVLSGSRRSSPAGPLATAPRLDKPYLPEAVLEALAGTLPRPPLP
jgi:hypothetical protein